MVNRSGFTLLETAVALAIVGLIAITALAAVGSRLRASTRAVHALEARALAQHRLASAVLAPPRGSGGSLSREKMGRFPAPFGSYQWRMTKRPVRERGSGLIEITVRVCWRDGGYTLSTRMSDLREIMRRL